MKDWTRKIIGLVARRALCRVLRRNDAHFTMRTRSTASRSSIRIRIPGDAQHHAHSAASCPDLPTTVRTDLSSLRRSRFSREFSGSFPPDSKNISSPQGNNGRITPFSCAALPGRLSFPNRYPNEDFARLSSGRSNPKTVCDRIRPIGRVAIVTQYSRKRKRT